MLVEIHNIQGFILTLRLKNMRQMHSIMKIHWRLLSHILIWRQDRQLSRTKWVLLVSWQITPHLDCPLIKPYIHSQFSINYCGSFELCIPNEWAETSDKASVMGVKMLCKVILRRNKVKAEITEHYFYPTLFSQSGSNTFFSCQLNITSFFESVSLSNFWLWSYSFLNNLFNISMLFK